MPEDGAAGTSAAVFGSWRGGNGTWGPRGRGGADDLREAPDVPEVPLMVVARPAMADVERIAVGRRASASRLVEDPACGSVGTGLLGSPWRRRVRVGIGVGADWGGGEEYVADFEVTD